MYPLAPLAAEYASVKAVQGYTTGWLAAFTLVAIAEKSYGVIVFTEAAGGVPAKSMSKVLGSPQGLMTLSYHLYVFTARFPYVA